MDRDSANRPTRPLRRSVRRCAALSSRPPLGVPSPLLLAAPCVFLRGIRPVAPLPFACALSASPSPTVASLVSPVLARSPQPRSPRCPPRPLESHCSQQRAAQGCRRGSHPRRRRARRRARFGIAHCRRAATPRLVVAAATLTGAATATTHVVAARRNRATVSRHAAHAPSRASNMISAITIVVTNRLARSTAAIHTVVVVTTVLLSPPPTLCAHPNHHRPERRRLRRHRRYRAPSRHARRRSIASRRACRPVSPLAILTCFGAPRLPSSQISPPSSRFLLSSSR